MFAFAYSKSRNVVELQALLIEVGEKPECSLSNSVKVINEHLASFGELKAISGARLANLALFGLYHQVGCEVGIRFAIKMMHEAELWQKRTLPPLGLEAAPLIDEHNHSELAGITLVLKRNGEPMVFFTEEHELNLTMSTLEAQSRMMTLREGAQVLRGHFLLS